MGEDLKEWGAELDWGNQPSLATSLEGEPGEAGGVKLEGRLDLPSRWSFHSGSRPAWKPQRFFGRGHCYMG